jgi:hypothetical protein
MGKNIKTGLKEIVYDVIGWTKMAQDSILQQRAHLNTVMKLHVP